MGENSLRWEAMRAMGRGPGMSFMGEQDEGELLVTEEVSRGELGTAGMSSSSVHCKCHRSAA
jgi:hypothetical protein